MIVHVSKYASALNGGIERCVLDLSEISDSRVIAHGLQENLKNSDFQIYRDLFRCGFKPISFKLMFELIIGKFKNDDLVLHFPCLYVLLFALFKIRCGKLIVFWHSDAIGFILFRGIFDYFTKRTLRYADIIICTSKDYALHSRILRNEKFSKKIRILNLGVATRDVPDDNLILERFKRKQLLCVGRFVEYKGQQSLFKILSYLPADFSLVLVGKGGLENKYRSIIEDMGIANRIVFLKDLSDSELSDVYRSSSLFLFPSLDRREAYGLALCEALQHGLPSISRFILGSGVNTVNLGNDDSNVIDHNDFELKCAERILFLFSSVEEYYKATTASAKFAHLNLSISRMQDKFAEILNDKW